MTITMLPPPPPALRAVTKDPAARAPFRPDIEGLRAIAVLAVVAFHASIPGLDGGFVGVDIFFVISGYLITGQLLREGERTGRLRLGAFYARRLKRIVPPAAVVLAATAVAAYALLPRLTAYRYSFDLGASLLYVANWRFIGQGKDYLAASTDESPALHFWSLAVEEQFYLVWPLLVIIGLLLAIRLSASGRRLVVAFVLLLVTAGSLAASVVLTASDPGLAYMATFTRAWQFGVGGLLAAAMLPRRGSARAERRVAAWLRAGAALVGTTALVGSIVLIDGSTPYPGVAALLPTLGAAALILAGPRSPSGAVLSVAPMRAIGRISYSWYLWHWPVLIIFEARFGDVSWPVKCGLAVVAAALAVATYQLVERPTRRLGAITADLGASAITGLAASLAAGAVIIGVAVQVDSDLNGPVVASAGAVATSQEMFYDYFTKQATITSGSTNPTPLAASTDFPERKECLVEATTEQPLCEWGAGNTRSVVLFGDSVAHQWQPAFQELAETDDVAFTLIAQAGCSAADLRAQPGEKGRFAQSYCTDWREQQLRRIIAKKPDLVVLSSSSGYPVSAAESAAGWRRTIDRLVAAKIRVTYLRATPQAMTDVPECVSGALDRWADCAFTPKGADEVVPKMVETGSLAGVGVIDATTFLCRTERCPAVRNGLLLYRDGVHITATAALALTPVIRESLRGAGVL